MNYINDLHDMCDVLSRELGEANEKIRQSGGKLSGSDLDYVDKLTHALKSVKTTIAMMEAEDGGSARGYMYPRNSYEGEYRGNGASYRRYSRRDSMGRYSRDGDMVAELRELMQDAPDEQTRKEFERFIQKIERM